MLHNYGKHFDSIMVSLNYFREDFQRVKTEITTINYESKILFGSLMFLTSNYYMLDLKGELIYCDS